LSNIQQNIIKFIKGEYLFNKEAFKNWRMILFVIFLLILMIKSAHLVDEKVMRLSKLKKQENEMRAEYIALRSKTMKLKLETTLIEEVKDMGLHPPEKPPQVIREVNVEQINID
jgi:cell division protein FtsB